MFINLTFIFKKIIQSWWKEAGLYIYTWKELATLPEEHEILKNIEQLICNSQNNYFMTQWKMPWIDYNGGNISILWEMADVA